MGSSQIAEKLEAFRQQMTDYARGQELRRLRDERHLSQEDAAHELGVSVKSLRNWESGKAIKWENAQAAARFYGVDPEGLVSRELVEEPDPDQLERIEAKLDLLLDHLGITDTPTGGAVSPAEAQAIVGAAPARAKSPQR